MHISIIVPAKNESQNISNLFTRIHTACSTAGLPYTIIFINDGSTDTTADILKQIGSDYPLTIITHEQSRGKANSILEGVEAAQTDFVVMIDADLQYPPEAIPGMVQKTPEVQIVVARRTINNEKIVRKALSKIHAYLFGHLLFGLDCDIQSGLKLLPRELVTHLDRSNITAWTLDLSLLHTAKQLEYKIGEVPITFTERSAGQSKVNIFRSIYEHTYTALKIKFFSKKIV